MERNGTFTVTEPPVYEDKGLMAQLASRSYGVIKDLRAGVVSAILSPSLIPGLGPFTAATSVGIKASGEGVKAIGNGVQQVAGSVSGGIKRGTTILVIVAGLILLAMLAPYVSLFKRSQ